MKLLRCLNCHDIRAITYSVTKCKCKQSWGYYLKDGIWAHHGGNSVLLGMKNQDLQILFPNCVGAWWVIPEGGHINYVSGSAPKKPIDFRQSLKDQQLPRESPKHNGQKAQK
jgi:hypothetical protein